MNQFSSLKYVLHSLIVEAKHVASGLSSHHHLAVPREVSEGGGQLHFLIMLPLGLHVISVLSFGIRLLDPPLRFGLSHFQPGLRVLSDDLRLGVRDYMLLLLVGLGLLQDLDGFGFRPELCQLFLVLGLDEPTGLQFVSVD